MRENFNNLFWSSNFPLALARNSSKLVLNLGTSLKNVSQPCSRFCIVGFCRLVDYQVFHGPSTFRVSPACLKMGEKFLSRLSWLCAAGFIFYLPRRVEMSYFFQHSSLVINMPKAAHFIELIQNTQVQYLERVQLVRPDSYL